MTVLSVGQEWLRPEERSLFYPWWNHNLRVHIDQTFITPNTQTIPRYPPLQWVKQGRTAILIRSAPRPHLTKPHNSRWPSSIWIKWEHRHTKTWVTHLGQSKSLSHKEDHIMTLPSNFLMLQMDQIHPGQCRLLTPKVGRSPMTPASLRLCHGLSKKI